MQLFARRVRAGETIILCDRHKPCTEIRPLAGIAPKRRLGQLVGACIVPLAFVRNSTGPRATLRR